MENVCSTLGEVDAVWRTCVLVGVTYGERVFSYGHRVRTCVLSGEPSPKRMFPKTTGPNVCSSVHERVFPYDAVCERMCPLVNERERMCPLVNEHERLCPIVCRTFATELARNVRV